MNDKPGGHGPGVGSVKDMVDRVKSTALRQGAKAGWDKAASSLAGAINERDAKIAQHERTIDALRKRVRQLESDASDLGGFW